MVWYSGKGEVCSSKIGNWRHSVSRNKVKAAEHNEAQLIKADIKIPLCVCGRVYFLSRVKAKSMKFFVETKAPGKRTLRHLSFNLIIIEMEQMQVRYAGWHHANRFWCSVLNSCKTKMTKCHFKLDLTLIKQSVFSRLNIWKNKTRNCKTAHLRPFAIKHVNEGRSHRWVVDRWGQSLSLITWSCMQQCDFCSETIQSFLTDASNKAYKKYLCKDASMLRWQFYCYGS